MNTGISLDHETRGIVHSFKEKTGVDLYTIATSLAAPQIWRRAEEIARALDESLPEGDWLRTKGAEIAIIILRSNLLDVQKSQSGATAAIIGVMRKFIFHFCINFYRMQSARRHG